MGYAKDEEFSRHSRFLPPGLIAARHLQLPWSHNVRDSFWLLNTDKLKDESRCFIYFNKDGADFLRAVSTLTAIP